ncbi:MAG TPA: metal-dependent transcriptional regulator [Sedimentisphaerales bacterium]|nr:metal-dependent transcriptional regulator [Sedimentisphaerales bacterium]
MAGAKDNNLSASLEDYLEAIYNLAAESKVARSKDIAKLLSVAKPSVTGALQILRKKGLANYEAYGFVTLTGAGRAAAAEIARKHEILKSFLTDVLGIEPGLAQRAACKAEHTLGPKVISRLLGFIEFVGNENDSGYDLAGKFKKYYARKRTR